MKKHLSLFILSLCIFQCGLAQNLTKYTEYYDYWQTRPHIVYTTLPNGNWHGDAKYYSEAGDHTATETYKNGEITYLKKYFRDGSIQEEGTVFQNYEKDTLFFRSAYAYYDRVSRTYGCSSYKLYHINKAGTRKLTYYYNCYRNKYDDRYHIKSLVFYNINDGSIVCKLTASEDHKTEQFEFYDKGKKIVDYVYNNQTNLLTVNEYNKPGAGFAVNKGVIKRDGESEEQDENSKVFSCDFQGLKEVGEETQYSRDYVYDDENSKIFYSQLPNNVKSRCFLIPYMEFYDLCGIKNDRNTNWNDIIGAFCPSYQVSYLDINRIISLDVVKPYARLLLLPTIYEGKRFTYVGEFDGCVANGQGAAALYYSNNNPYIILSGTFENNTFVKGDYILYEDDGVNIIRSYSGELLNGIYHGYGKYQDNKNNWSYEGYFANGQLHGEGCKQSEGDVYTGIFNDGALEKGTIKLANGDEYDGTYVGTFDDGSFSGTLKYANGDIYMGNIVNGKYKGEAELSFASGKHYVGTFEDGLFVKGKIKSANGDIYTGSVLNDEYQGDGELCLSSGDVYAGTFSKGLLVNGTINFRQGDVYKGELLNGKYHGYGRLEYGIGGYYDGKFENGKFEGNGEFCCENVKYLGNWVSNIPNGQFDITLQDGTVYKLSYNQGNSLDSVKIVFANGDTYEGTIVNDIYLIGKYVYKNGNYCLYTGKKIMYYNADSSKAKKKDYELWDVNKSQIAKLNELIKRPSNSK